MQQKYEECYARNYLEEEQQHNWHTTHETSTTDATAMLSVFSCSTQTHASTSYCSLPLGAISLADSRRLLWGVTVRWMDLF